MTLCLCLSWVNKVWPRNLKKWWIVCKLGRVLLESALIKNSSHNAFSFPCNLPELPLTQALLQLSTRSEIPKLQKSFEGKEERQKSIKRGEQKEGKSNLWHENLIKTHKYMWGGAAGLSQSAQKKFMSDNWSRVLVDIIPCNRLRAHCVKERTV